MIVSRTDLIEDAELLAKVDAAVAAVGGVVGGCRGHGCSVLPYHRTRVAGLRSGPTTTGDGNGIDNGGYQRDLTRPASRSRSSLRKNPKAMTYDSNQSVDICFRRPERPREPPSRLSQ
jgi:hypothetical protein